MVLIFGNLCSELNIFSNANIIKYLIRQVSTYYLYNNRLTGDSCLAETSIYSNLVCYFERLVLIQLYEFRALVFCIKREKMLGKSFMLNGKVRQNETEVIAMHPFEIPIQRRRNVSHVHREKFLCCTEEISIVDIDMSTI